MSDIKTELKELCRDLEVRHVMSRNIKEGRELDKLGFPERLQSIRSTYEFVGPEIIQRHPYKVDPYFFDWMSIFTPIEKQTWDAIRRHGVALYPQYPVLDYFIDFGNPALKIGLEADGKTYHDKEKDRKRDEKLFEEGWRIFRVTGTECRRVLENPLHRDHYDYIRPEDRERDMWDWFMNTADGVVFALGVMYFNKKTEEYAHRCATETLHGHKSLDFELTLEDEQDDE